MADNYSSLKTLEGLEAVRKRPGMYIGSTTSQDGRNPRGLLQIAQEILSNSADEAMVGYGDQIDMIIHEDQSVTIKDQGRGLPMGKDYDDAIRAFTKLHTSGKFDASNYSKSGGQNGIGGKATNAVSKWLEVKAVTSVGDAYRILFNQETVVEKEHRKRKEGEPTGTSVTFLPDTDIFETIDWSLEDVQNRVDQLSYLTPGVKYTLLDERIELPEEEEEVDEEDLNEDDVEQDKEEKKVVNYFEYLHEHGMKDYVSDYIEDIEYIGMKEPLWWKASDEESLMDVEISLAYIESIGEQVFSFANGIPTYEGGPHEDGATRAVHRAMNDYGIDKKLIRSSDRLTPKDTRDGLVLAISVGIPEDLLQFESQTKEKLGTTEINPYIYDVLYKNLLNWLHDHEKEAKAVFEKMADAKSAREAARLARSEARAARSVKNRGKDRLLLSTKLTTARSRKPEERELFLVEGDSAGGSAKTARDSYSQAVLPLRGKPLNVSGLRLGRILKNEEISTLISVMGAGVGQEFDIDKVQYHKLIFMADADDDGYHILELLINVVWHLMPDLIKEGYVYVAQAPLFRFDRYVRGKREKAFAMDMAEYKEMLDDHKGWKVTRLKGLGEMNPEELKETTMDTESRRLVQLTVKDAKEVSKKLELFLGKSKKGGLSASQARRQWLAENVVFEEIDELAVQDV